MARKTAIASRLGPLAHLGAHLVGDRRAQQPLVAVGRGLGDLAGRRRGLERHASTSGSRPRHLASSSSCRSEIRNPSRSPRRIASRRCEGMSRPGSCVLEVVAVDRRLGSFSLPGRTLHAQHPLGGERPAQLGALARRSPARRSARMSRAPARAAAASSTPFSGIDVRPRQLLGQLAAGGRGEQRVGQRLQPLLAGDLGAGPPLRLVGEVEVLELLLGRRRRGSPPRAPAVSFPCSRMLSRMASRRSASSRKYSRRLAIVSSCSVLQAAGRLLAVAGDEGDGRPLGEQLGGGLDLARPAARPRWRSSRRSGAPERRSCSCSLQPPPLQYRAGAYPLIERSPGTFRRVRRLGELERPDGRAERAQLPEPFIPAGPTARRRPAHRRRADGQGQGGRPARPSPTSWTATRTPS